jgi:hypothetical protein
MKQALETAAKGGTGKTVPSFLRVLMLCYESGSGNIMNLMRGAAVLTVLVLGSFLALSWLRGRRNAAPPGATSTAAGTKGGGEA